MHLKVHEICISSQIMGSKKTKERVVVLLQQSAELIMERFTAFGILALEYMA